MAAAGRGERAGPGEPKQFRDLAGVPLLLRALRPFASHPLVSQIVVALPADVAAAPPAWLDALVGDRLALVAGGAMRSASVLAGLRALDDRCEIVLVHDAARPFVSRATIDAVIAKASAGVGGVPAVRVGDTLKRAEEGTLEVQETVPRNDLWRAQTPQGFPRPMLEAAFAHAEESLDQFTDESALVEAYGGVVHIVPDRTSNIKVTTADDFRVASALVVP